MGLKIAKKNFKNNFIFFRKNTFFALLFTFFAFFRNYTLLFFVDYLSLKIYISYIFQKNIFLFFIFL